MSDYKSPEHYRSLRAQGKLPWQQREAVIHTSAQEQRDAMRAKRQEHQQRQDHARNVRQLAQSQLDTIRASTINSPESILAMQKERRDELLRAGNTDRARYYSNLIAIQQAKVDAEKAAKEFESSEEFTSAMDVVQRIRPLVEQYTKDNLVHFDASIEVFKQTADADGLFSSIAKLSTQATIAENAARREQAAKLAHQQQLLSQATTEQAEQSKANDAMIAAAAQLKAAE